MTLKVKKIKNGIEKGQCVPNDTKIVGKWIEDQLENNGHIINRGAGVDLTEINVEVKSRKVSSNSAHTIGRMTTKDIINTPYDSSSIKNKIQTQYRVEYDDNCKVNESKIYDFSEEWIQELIKLSYESGRAEIAAGLTKNNTATHGVGIFQRDKDKDQWQYRITNAGMKKIKTMADQPSFAKIFKY
jgi:methyl coenzyme M reductase beta subunit